MSKFWFTLSASTLLITTASQGAVIRDFGTGVGFDFFSNGATQDTTNATFVIVQDTNADAVARLSFSDRALLAGQSNESLQIVLRRGATDTQVGNIALEIRDLDGTAFKYNLPISSFNTSSFVTFTAAKNLSNADSVGAVGTTAGLDLSNLRDVGIVGTFGSGQVFNLEIDRIQTTAVPEPTSMALLGLGGVALLRRRRARG